MPRKLKRYLVEPRVTVECVTCGRRKEIGPGDVAPGDVPSCDKCLSPCVAVSARGRI